MTEKPDWEFIIPKETDEYPTLKFHQPNWYKVDVEKLQQSSMKEASYLFAALLVADDYEYFDKVKHLLDIPQPPKTLDEISQELDEKIDKLIEDTKRNFYGSKIYADSKYEKEFDRIFDNFTYAQENEVFPLKYTLSGTFDYSKLSVSGGVNIGSPSFVIKQSNNHEGYYTIGEDKYYRFYMEHKPNFVFRWFVRQLMGFKWVNEK